MRLLGFEPVDVHEASTMAPLALAYLGDAVFELYVRQRLLRGAARPTAELHRQAVRRVRAAAQAAALRSCWEELRGLEAVVARRARNARYSSHRGVDPAVYHYSTAFEALVGFLYLTGSAERLEQVMQLAFEMVDTRG